MGMDPVTITMIASALVAGVSVYSSMEQGKQAKQTADDNAELSRRQGAQETDAAVAQAEKIRRVAALNQSEANAALAASGVSIGEGTALKINEEITKNSEQDAYATILNGTRGASTASAQASMYESAGSNALNAGYLNAGSSLLSAGAAFGKGWKTSAGNVAGGVKAPTGLMWGER